MLDKLKKLRVRFKVGSGCACRKKGLTYTYILPMRLDGTIVEAMQSLGKNARPFNQTCMIKIETPSYSIIGINKLKEIKIMFKNNKIDPQVLNRFETSLAAYVHGKKVK